MSLNLPVKTIMRPSYEDPGFILEQFQTSSFIMLLSGETAKVRLKPGDQYVYKDSLKLKTRSQAGQSAGNLLPSADLIAAQNSCPAYLHRARFTYDGQDQDAAANWNISLAQANILLGRLAIFQQIRNGTLYGTNLDNNEGLINTPGANTSNLPQDSYGHTGAKNYDAGQMAQYLLNEVLDMLTATYQLGMPGVKVKILSPQRLFGAFATTDIVQLTNYQRDGSGVATAAVMVKEVLSKSGISYDWGYDDTLIGKGDNGTDLVIMTLEEIKVNSNAQLNTNITGNMVPQDLSVNNVYMDMAAPMIIPTPAPDGAITQVQQLRVTPGWCFRPKALTLISMPYEDLPPA